MAGGRLTGRGRRARARVAVTWLATWLALALVLVVPVAEVGHRPLHDLALVHPLFPHDHPAEHAGHAAEHADHAQPVIVAPEPGLLGGGAASGRFALIAALTPARPAGRGPGVPAASRALSDQHLDDVVPGPPRQG